MTTTNPRSRRLRLVQGPALALGSLVLFLVLAEVLIRALGLDVSMPGRGGQFRFDQANAAARPHHVRDPRLGWRLRPNQKGKIDTNAQGFRGPPFALPKPPGTLRLLFAGDSNPLGFGLDDEAAPYPFRVQEILTHFLPDPLGRRYESIDLGVDGYSSYQTRLLLEEWLPRLDADVVCVQVGFNDYCLASRPDAAGFRTSFVTGLIERSHAARWLRRQLLRSSLQAPSRTAPVPRVPPAEYELHLREIVRAIKARGALPILVTTAVRPAVPLVVNEVPVQSKEGVVWMTQDAWLRERMRAASVPADSLGDPRYVPLALEAEREHPDWPLVPYMVATALRRQGRADEARPYEERWRTLDENRTVFDAYAAAMHRVGAEEGAIVVDEGACLEAYLEGEGTRSPTDLYVDFVHLDGRGHVVLATEIARAIATSLGIEPPPAIATTRPPT